ncbi:MAG TPA: hypothetical protein VMT72_00630 [Pseudolabrys sp.]|nr:hypothetical protein [Pseudolabrys sp.]
MSAAIIMVAASAHAPGVLVCLHDTEITILLHTSPHAVSIVMPIDNNDGSINPRRK